MRPLRRPHQRPDGVEDHLELRVVQRGRWEDPRLTYSCASRRLSTPAGNTSKPRTNASISWQRAASAVAWISVNVSSEIAISYSASRPQKSIVARFPSSSRSSTRALTTDVSR